MQAEMSFQEKEKYPNLSRWFRLMQEDSELRSKNKKVIFTQTPLYSSTTSHWPQKFIVHLPPHLQKDFFDFENLPSLFCITYAS